MEINSKQQNILDAASELFAEHGFDGASVRAIANKAGVNVSMISYYFGSKEKMLEALINNGISDSREMMYQVLNSDKSYLEKVDDLVALYIQRIHKKHRIHRIVNVEYANGNRNIDFEEIAKQKQASFKLLEGFIHDGQKAGAFKKDIEIPLIIPSIFGTYFYFYDNRPYYINHYGLNTQKSIEEFVATKLTTHIQNTIKGLLTYEK